MLVQQLEPHLVLSGLVVVDIVKGMGRRRHGPGPGPGPGGLLLLGGVIDEGGGGGGGSRSVGCGGFGGG